MIQFRNEVLDICCFELGTDGEFIDTNCGIEIGYDCSVDEVSITSLALMQYTTIQTKVFNTIDWSFCNTIAIT